MAGQLPSQKFAFPQMSFPVKRPTSLDMKLVVLGPAYVGKTSIITRYCNNTFSEDTGTTIGAGFFTHTVAIDDTEVTLMLWDTAGEERFKSVAPSLLRGANGLVLTFDLTQARTFSDIDSYLDMFLDNCYSDPSQAPAVLLLGNKSDKDEREVSESEIERWVQKNRIPLYFPVSAKNGNGIQAAMQKFIEFLLDPEKTVQVSPIVIPMPVARQGERQGCCG
jgi:small GTP-binding protein